MDKKTTTAISLLGIGGFVVYVMWPCGFNRTAQYREHMRGIGVLLPGSAGGYNVGCDGDCDGLGARGVRGVWRWAFPSSEAEWFLNANPEIGAALDADHADAPPIDWARKELWPEDALSGVEVTMYRTIYDDGVWHRYILFGADELRAEAVLYVIDVPIDP